MNGRGQRWLGPLALAAVLAVSAYAGWQAVRWRRPDAGPVVPEAPAASPPAMSPPAASPPAMSPPVASPGASPPTMSPGGGGQPNLVTRAQEEVVRLPHALVGRPAPDVAWTGLDGRRLRLADFRGKPVVLAYFTTW